MITMTMAIMNTTVATSNSNSKHPTDADPSERLPFTMGRRRTWCPKRQSAFLKHMQRPFIVFSWHGMAYHGMAYHQKFKNRRLTNPDRFGQKKRRREKDKPSDACDACHTLVWMDG